MFLFKPTQQTTFIDAPEMTGEQIFSHCSHEKTKSLTEQVRQASSEEDVRSFKSQMFSFYPSIDPRKRPEKNSNGIFQFDIDSKENQNLDIAGLKKTVMDYACTVYSMTSPRGGLKFSVQTNFHEIVSDDVPNYNAIFAKAHDLVAAEIKKEIGEFVNDSCSRSIMQTCILSYDPDGYANFDAEPILFSHEDLKIWKEDVFQEDAEYMHDGDINSTDDLEHLREEFLYLLEGIPSNLNFENRRVVNFTALFLFGSQGVDMMMGHWIVEDRKKLKQDLSSQLKSAKHHSMNGVRALSSNYIKASNTLVEWNGAAPSEMIFPERMTIKDARNELKAILDDFFMTPKTTIVKAPCGIGKSTYTAQLLARTAYKVLYLAPSHSLAEEIRQSVIQQQKHLKQCENSPIKRKWSFRLPPSHIFGRYAVGEDGITMCENKHIRDFYGKANVIIPRDECLKCHLNPCRYTSQFDHLANIRFATHNDLRNTPSNWENGSRGEQKSLSVSEHEYLETAVCGFTNYSRTRSGNWIPDFVVVDEAFLSGESYDLTTDVKLKSLHKILLSVLNGEDFLSAIKINEAQLRKDYDSFAANEVNSHSVLGYEYINCKTKYSDAEAVFLKIFFEALEAGFITSDLSAVRCDKKINPTRLNYNPVLTIHDRFQNVPILVFDATAEKSIYEHIYPDADFHEITAQPSDHFEVWQCQNVTLSKKDFREKSDLFNIVAQDISSKIKGHGSKRVGLISYKSVGMRGENQSFVNTLQDRITKLLNDSDVEIKSLHFGNLRGSNTFNDCDLVFVVGRYLVNDAAILGKAQQILGHSMFDDKMLKRDRHSRFGEDAAISFQNYVYQSDEVQSLRDAFGRAETIQAIFRARPFTDDPKTVYYYSNEALGGDVSIDGVFDLPFGELFQFLSKLKEIGFCHIAPRELKKLGFGEHASTPTGRDERIKQLMMRGVEKYQFVMRRNGKDVTRAYLVTEVQKLKDYLHVEKFEVLDMVRLFS